MTQVPPVSSDDEEKSPLGPKSMNVAQHLNNGVAIGPAAKNCYDQNKGQGSQPNCGETYQPPKERAQKLKHGIENELENGCHEAIFALNPLWRKLKKRLCTIH
jgi:hypothetical protein